MALLPHDPLRLDVATFAAQSAHLNGTWPLAQMERLVDFHMAASVSVQPEVAWEIEGELRPVRGGEPEIWLHVNAQCELAMCCQRCLGAVPTPLEVDVWLRFVADEALAAELDADSEDDVLALQRWTNMSELLEDELLLALPLVPRHEVCPDPLPLPTDELPFDDQPPVEHPFAKLALLKKS
jgi:uncharacterized protein